MIHTISEQVVDMITDALERGLDQGEGMEFDVSLMAMPGPDGRPHPMIGMAFMIPATALGEGHSAMFMMPPAVPIQEQIDDLIRQVIQGLLATRSQVAQAAMAQGNGHKDIPGSVSKSGLILPPR